MGANTGLAAVLAHRSPRGAARVFVWGWLAVSGTAVLVLSLFAAMLAG